MTVLLVDHDRRGVATVTLNRPNARNAFDADLMTAVADTFATLADARLVVLSANGPAFCAGADLEWMRAGARMSPDQARADSEHIAGMLRAVHDCPAPVVARVQGPVFGGGTGLLACADVVVAAPTAVFSFSEVRLGLAPAVIAAYLLPRIGLSAATALFMTGERFDAERAREIGLVHVVAEDLDQAVTTTVDDLLRGGPAAQRATKSLCRYVARSDFESSVSFALDLISSLRAGAEAQEGVAAFFARREPEWSR